MRLRDEYYPKVYMTVTPTQGRDAHGKADSRILGLCAQSPLFTPPLLASLSPSLTPTLTNCSPSQRCTRDHRAGGTRLRQGRVCQSSAFCPSSQSQSRIQEDSPTPQQTQVRGVPEALPRRENPALFKIKDRPGQQ